jgi:hypothetical protein
VTAGCKVIKLLVIKRSGWNEVTAGSEVKAGTEVKRLTAGKVTRVTDEVMWCKEKANKEENWQMNDFVIFYCLNRAIRVWSRFKWFRTDLHRQRDRPMLEATSTSQRRSDFMRLHIKRRGRVVNNISSHSGGPGFKSWTRNRLFWGRFSWFSSVPMYISG